MHIYELQTCKNVRVSGSGHFGIKKHLHVRLKSIPTPFMFHREAGYALIACINLLFLYAKSLRCFIASLAMWSAILLCFLGRRSSKLSKSWYGSHPDLTIWCCMFSQCRCKEASYWSQWTPSHDEVISSQSASQLETTNDKMQLDGFLNKWLHCAPHSRGDWTPKNK